MNETEIIIDYKLKFKEIKVTYHFRFLWNELMYQLQIHMDLSFVLQDFLQHSFLHPYFM